MNNISSQSLVALKELLYQVKGELSEFESLYSVLLERVESLADKAERDELSGLLRRKAFFDRWHRLLDRCVALGIESGVLIVDVDHFKKINDTRGHAAGDEVIRQLGQILRRFESSGSIVGRYGGEEFVVAFSGGEERGLRICSEIQNCLHSVGVTASFGVDVASVHQAPSLDRADGALYDAKRSGRNRACVARREG
jgi:diguanylate cyclase (GGDEF)-like protein